MTLRQGDGMAFVMILTLHVHHLRCVRAELCRNWTVFHDMTV